MSDSTISIEKNTITKSVRGFTLVEILIVLALIGIVAGLAMQNLGGIFGGSKVKAAQQWVNSTGEAYVTSYFALVGDYLNLSWALRRAADLVGRNFFKDRRDVAHPCFLEGDHDHFVLIGDIYFLDKLL